MLYSSCVPHVPLNTKWSLVLTYFPIVLEPSLAMRQYGYSICIEMCVQTWVIWSYWIKRPGDSDFLRALIVIFFNPLRIRMCGAISNCGRAGSCLVHLPRTQPLLAHPAPPRTRSSKMTQWRLRGTSSRSVFAVFLVPIFDATDT